MPNRPKERTECEACWSGDTTFGRLEAALRRRTPATASLGTEIDERLPISDARASRNDLTTWTMCGRTHIRPKGLRS